MPTRREGNILSDTNATEGRRQLLKAIALGGGAVVAVKILPESWTTPVIDTVMLPVHAQASGAGGTKFCGSSVQSGNPPHFRALEQETVAAMCSFEKTSWEELMASCPPDHRQVTH